MRKNLQINKEMFELLFGINKHISPHNYKKGDVIQVGKNRTTGVIVRTTDEDIIFKTFDKTGWAEASTYPEHITKTKPRKPNTVNLKLKRYLKKYNKKLFSLNEDFDTVCFDKKVTIEKGTLMIIDEHQDFLDWIDKKCSEGYHPTQLYISYIEGETVFSVVRCFRTDTHEFLYVPLKKLTPFKWNSKLFNMLVLKEKDRLLNFISNSNEYTNYGISFHKGLGKSILLHGIVGSGKTLTAEALSHKLRKPLIRVDIENTNPALSIRGAFKIAERYDGIVFIDEAELLIANRSSQYGDIASIRTLLKYIEDFPGVVIFSTNYVNDIDPALNNRIDMKIHYEINPEIREQIWKQLLPKKLDKKFPLIYYKEKNLNGRDIQKIILNACRKANQKRKKCISINDIDKEVNYRLKEKNVLEEGTPDVSYFG